MGNKIKDERCYRIWHSILNRAYYHKNSSETDKRYSYEDVSICKEWMNYNNFEEWYLQNYYELPNGERVEIDKDILFKHNKIYSPETCIFVPQKINSLFVNRSKETIKNHINKITDVNGKELPVGITWCKDKNLHRYRASLNIGNQKVINLGRFKTLEEAFVVYKKAKEDRIKQLANEYKPYIPQKLYNALMNYSVEMDD